MWEKRLIKFDSHPGSTPGWSIRQAMIQVPSIYLQELPELLSCLFTFWTHVGYDLSSFYLLNYTQITFLRRG